MNAQIDTAIKRARGYWFVDGFTEMAAGGLFILLAGLLLFSGSVSQASLHSWLLSVAGEISIAKLVGLLAAILILWWLKDHFTYPRTGFVRGNRVTTARVLFIIRNAILFLLLPIFGVLAASLLITSPNRVLSAMPIWFPIGLSLLWTILLALAGEWLGLRRFHLVGAAILLAGITIGIWQFAVGLPTFPVSAPQRVLPPDVLESVNRTLAGLGFLALISGVILMSSGLLTFLHYRQENPLPFPEDL